MFQSFPKPIPRVIERQFIKREKDAEERACRKAVDARDQHICFFPSCKAYANEKHHLLARSLGGQWTTDNIASACTAHHRLFKAGLIRALGDPDRGTLTVYATPLGQRCGIRIPPTRRTP